MGIKDSFEQLFNSDYENEIYFQVVFEKEGLYLLLESPEQLEVIANGEGSQLATHQYIQLEILAEQGLIDPIPNGFIMPNEFAVQLNEGARRLFGLPSRFDGYYKIETTSQLDQPDFKLTIIPYLAQGEEIHPELGYYITGALMEVSPNSKYLLTVGEYLAFDAYQKHKEDKVTPIELRNLTLVHALQRAQNVDSPDDDGLLEIESMSIKLDHFDEIEIVVPDEVKLTIEPQENGSYLLLPNYGNDVEQSELVNRLGQLEHGERVGSLRVGNKRIMLDEKTMAATRELLGTGSKPKIIDKGGLKHLIENLPAYIDATLINLDEGFSSRVLGIADYVAVNYADFEDSEIDWFSENPLDDIVTSAAEKQEANSGDSPDSTDSAELNGPPEVKNKKALAVKENVDGVEYTIDDVESFSAKTINDVAFLEEINWGKYKFKPYDYQEDGIRWILGLAQRAMSATKENVGKSGGLLADDMGLGKTFMSLAALAEYMDLCDKNNIGHKPMLIVAPLSLIENWKAEVKKFFGSENGPFRDIVLLHADADLNKFRSTRKGGSEFNLNKGVTEANIKYVLKVGKEHSIERLDIPKRLVITTYETLAGYQFSLSKVDWSIAIFDEAQKVKNPNTLASIVSKAIKVDFKLLATGTPVENGLNDFWSLMDIAQPGYLNSYRDFYDEYIRPVNGVEEGSKAQLKYELGEALRNQVGALMCRRTKEDNLDGLPTKTIHAGTQATSASELYLESLESCMSGSQQAIYDQIVDTALDPTDVRKGKALTALHGLRNASLHPRLADGRGLKKLPAYKDEAEKIIAESCKLKQLIQLLDKIQDRGEKVLVFLVNKELQLFLKIALQKIYQIDVPVINGDVRATAKNDNTETRIRLIENFESNDGFGVMVLSPIAAGVGLTIVGANNVIHLERHWNPAKEAQATDRAYRIGQTKNVNVYLPIVHHPSPKIISYEENLHTLLANKTSWSNAVVVPEKFTESQFSCFDSSASTNGETNLPYITIKDVDNASWEWFEAFSALLLAKHYGGQTELTAQGNDRGADSIVRGREANYVVQSKHSEKNALGTEEAISGVYKAKLVYEGFLKLELKMVVIANQKIKRNVINLGKKYGEVDFFDRKRLIRLMKDYPLTVLDISKLLNQARLSKPNL